MGETRREPDPRTVPLRNERHAVVRGGALRGTLVPDGIGKRLLARERRGERRWRLGEGPQTKRPETKAFTGTDAPDLEAQCAGKNV